MSEEAQCLLSDQLSVGARERLRVRAALRRVLPCFRDSQSLNPQIPWVAGEAR